jgi:serine/threonine-protein kinase RsbW
VNIDVAVCLPQEAETVALIRTVVTNTLLLFGVADSCVEDIRLALSEACTNVIEHAASSDEYEVRVQVDDRQCVITVKDAGGAFNAEAFSAAMPDRESARGRGVAIMHAVVDRVEFRSEPESGTIVRLVKDLTVRDDGPISRIHRRSRGR